MRPKFQKQSALKFDGRIIPEAKPSGINVGLIPRPLGRVRLDTALLAAGLFINLYYSYSKSFTFSICNKFHETIAQLKSI